MRNVRCLTVLGRSWETWRLRWDRNLYRNTRPLSTCTQTLTYHIMPFCLTAPKLSSLISFLLAHQLAKLWLYLSWHDYNTVLKTQRCLKRYDHKKDRPLPQPSQFPYLFMSAVSKLGAHWGWAQTLFIFTGSLGLSPCKYSTSAWLN